MDKGIFRKKTLASISSPEQLDEYVKVTSVGIWLVLLALFALVLGVGVWALTGTIPDTVDVQGIVYGEDASRILAFAPMGMAQRMEPGMSVQVSPEYAPREEFGYMMGLIVSVGHKPVSEEELVDLLGQIHWVAPILPPGNPVLIDVEIVLRDGQPLWSNLQGESMVVREGSYALVSVVTRERRPLELLF